MRETKLLIVRHPETIANVTGRFVGRGDSPFTAEGELQARRLPAKLAAFAPDEVWTSPLHRAHIVAEKAAALAGVPLRMDDRLLELDFGDAEGMTFDELTAAGMPFNYRSAEEPVAPGGESRASIERRVAAMADELTARDGRFVVVAHGGVVRAMLVHVLGLSHTDVWAFHVHNAQLASVRVVDGHGMLEEYVAG
jgi:broad specificity phosphatase PhoE